MFGLFLFHHILDDVDTEEGLDDLGILQCLGGQTGISHSSLFQDVDEVGHGHGRRDILLDHED